MPDDGKFDYPKDRWGKQTEEEAACPTCGRGKTEYKRPVEWYMKNYGTDVSKWPYDPDNVTKRK